MAPSTRIEWLDEVSAAVLERDLTLDPNNVARSFKLLSSILAPGTKVRLTATLLPTIGLLIGDKPLAFSPRRGDVIHAMPDELIVQSGIPEGTVFTTANKHLWRYSELAGAIADELPLIAGTTYVKVTRYWRHPTVTVLGQVPAECWADAIVLQHPDGTVRCSYAIRPGDYIVSDDEPGTSIGSIRVVRYHHLLKEHALPSPTN